MKIKCKFKTIFLLFALIPNTICEENYDEEVFRTDTLDYAPGTFLLTKFVLLPTLATLGLKFLLLLPVFLSKIALLGVMNFVSTNLNLLLSGIIGVKHYFSGNKWKWNNEDNRQVEYEYLYPNQNLPAINHENIVSNYHQYYPTGADVPVAETKTPKSKQYKTPQNLNVAYSHKTPITYQTVYKCKRKTYGPDVGKYMCWTEALTERETKRITDIDSARFSTQSRKALEVPTSPSRGIIGESQTGPQRKMQ